MRTAQRRPKVQHAQIATVKSIPAPLKGWNARDGLAEMDQMDAVTLDNWFPGTSYVEMRGGYAEHTTAVRSALLTEGSDALVTEAGDALVVEGSGVDAGNIKTLMTYNALSGANKMFASTASGIYDASTAGSLSTAQLDRTNGKHQWTMFGDGTSNWLMGFNGTDKPAYYDGATWTAVDHLTSPALTGFPSNDTTQFISGNVFKGRVFLIPKNSLSFWYLPAGAAGGALLEFSLAAECKKGGYLVAMGTWTRDAGDGMDDVAVFLTSEGEAIIYQGNNPSSADSWAKIGAFFIGRPLGRRCITQYGGDMIVLTENGTFPLSAVLQYGSVNNKMALSFKIEKAFTDAARSYGSNFGWEATVYPAKNALIVNVPITEDGEHEQYVMNTITKSFCRFKEWDAETFCIFNGELYFATGSTVEKAWTGAIDGENDIEAYGKQSFNYFDSMGQLKRFTLFRPVLAVNGSLSYLVDIDVDFADDPIAGTATYTAVAGAVWDAFNWDEAYWASGQEIVKQWSTVSEWPGYCAAGKVKVATNALTVQWMSSDYVYETGGVL